ncbi:MAG TPA: response regulator [Candidatus Eisenbergiella merdipullorum]|uniref:Stage 0 sporulation protein A homolog n=1 Tax=Candidatus Eisenbergiella merdipullorum TaxID=2838553 RepID=A0A9D2I9E5_9FIRM|nr:response regulator [Candidatus Eisenbergiella merdipullorum]
MYSLVIAEDEFTTRRALVNMVRWNELGFRVEGEFSDGQELLDYLKNNVPDVILTDIKMIHVSGIEIARLVAEENLPIQIVFLSAYKDFSYAQEALEYHVAHYLLKPVDLARLREVFRGIKEKLDRQGIQENLMQDRLDHYNRLINYEKQQFVTDVYFGSLTNPKQMARRLGLIDSEGQGGSARLFLTKIVLRNDQQYKDFIADYGQQELQEQLVHLLGYFDRELEFYTINWNTTEEEELYVLGVFWENRASERIVYDPADLRDAVYNLMKIHVEIPTFQLLRSPAELAHCAEKVGRNESAEYLMKDKEYLQLLRDQNKLLYSYLCQNNPEQGMELAGTLFHNYMRGGMAFAQRQCIYTVTKLLDEAGRNDLMSWNRLYEQCMTPAAFSQKQPQALKGWLERCIKILFDHMGGQAEARQDTSIERVMDYLHKHYSEDITLAGIAEAVFLNPAYISRLIKEQIGKNYTDLVMELRIERAVELLENTDMYVYEIAEKVGYGNLKYFYKVFRKVKGKSPGDYRPADR